MPLSLKKSVKIFTMLDLKEVPKKKGGSKKNCHFEYCMKCKMEIFYIQQFHIIIMKSY